jgi:hypothetical protein
MKHQLNAISQNLEVPDLLKIIMRNIPATKENAEVHGFTISNAAARKAA